MYSVGFFIFLNIIQIYEGGGKIGSIAVIITFYTKWRIKEPIIIPLLYRQGFEFASIRYGFKFVSNIQSRPKSQKVNYFLWIFVLTDTIIQYAISFICSYVSSNLFLLMFVDLYKYCLNPSKVIFIKGIVLCCNLRIFRKISLFSELHHLLSESLHFLDHLDRIPQKMSEYTHLYTNIP